MNTRNARQTANSILKAFPQLSTVFVQRERVASRLYSSYTDYRISVHGPKMDGPCTGFNACTLAEAAKAATEYCTALYNPAVHIVPPAVPTML